ncbi:hypothetical protein L1276_001023 [Flavobacterium sp. HSC-32F16]|uniref:hypothetical protein n=1 Tax=Flavobacterium sp. HSC-32F16 TaxID=2910964 RepID=UPI0020A5D2BB|nr:hypothetical protein [Flavobacterium sp. HSC-32F16]MCP2025883.1 hypothetical protein [Flavobacterium sp. HSC-32F16]
MKKIKNLTFLIVLTVLFSCKRKEQCQYKSTVFKKDSLQLIKDIAIYGESSEGTEAKLFKKLYNSDSIINIETFGEMGNSKYTFTFNKKLLNARHITNHYREPIYINSTPKIIKKDTALLNNSNRNKFTALFYEYKSYFIKSKNKKKEIFLNQKWYGKYLFTMNENSDDWRDLHDISITIHKDSLTYSAKGFQLYQLYKLSVVERNDTLSLTFEKDLNNADSWALKKTKNFGIITFDNQSYKWVCPYIDINFNNGKHNTYILKKE